MVKQAPYRLSLPEDFTLVNPIDDVMPIGPSEWERLAILGLSVRHLDARAWKINLTEILEPSISVGFLEVRWYR